jgi:hypothetical protein
MQNQNQPIRQISAALGRAPSEESVIILSDNSSDENEMLAFPHLRNSQNQSEENITVSNDSYIHPSMSVNKVSPDIFSEYDNVSEYEFNKYIGEYVLFKRNTPFEPHFVVNKESENSELNTTYYSQSVQGLICQVCQKVPFDLRFCKICKERFCNRCAKEASEHNTNCYNSKHKYSDFVLPSREKLNRFDDNIKIVCEYGCKNDDKKPLIHNYRNIHEHICGKCPLSKCKICGLVQPDPTNMHKNLTDCHKEIKSLTKYIIGKSKLNKSETETNYKSEIQKLKDQLHHEMCKTQKLEFRLENAKKTNKNLKEQIYSNETTQRLVSDVQSQFDIFKEKNTMSKTNFVMNPFHDGLKGTNITGIKSLWINHAEKGERQIIPVPKTYNTYKEVLQNALMAYNISQSEINNYKLCDIKFKVKDNEEQIQNNIKPITTLNLIPSDLLFDEFVYKIDVNKIERKYFVKHALPPVISQPQKNKKKSIKIAESTPNLGEDEVYSPRNIREDRYSYKRRRGYENSKKNIIKKYYKKDYLD